MGLFDRGTEYRLEDHEPEKKKKEREIRPYRPPRPLSWLSCRILIALGAALLAYGVGLLLLHFGGTTVQARTNTRLDEAGNVETVAVRGMTTTVAYTFADGAGEYHSGTGSLFGNQEPVGDTIAVRYFSPFPALNMPAYRTEDELTPFGALLLGAIVIVTAISRLREIQRQRETE